MSEPKYILRGDPIPGGKLGEPKFGYEDFPRLLAKIEAHPELVTHVPPEDLEYYKSLMRKAIENNPA
ncbi:MAG: hypothetical protein IV090_24560 [Candidatus Sericytochromatia bacterium]|nr:hypothetical protein [Candidatus Sericytochromatia bacterium]